MKSKMTKTLTLVLLASMTYCLANAQQFILEEVDGENIDKFIGFSAFSTNEIPIGEDNSRTESPTIFFFNPDFSFRKSITVTPTIDGQKGMFWLDWMESDSNKGNAFYSSQHLFNDDDLFEFLIYGYITTDEVYDKRKWGYFVYN